MKEKIEALIQLLREKGEELDPKLVDAALALLRGEAKAETQQGVNVIVNLLLAKEERKPKRRESKPKPSDDLLAQVVDSPKVKEFVDNIASAG